MFLQRQHFVLSYLKTLSVGRPGFEPATSSSADRRLSHWANRTAVMYLCGFVSLCLCVLGCLLQGPIRLKILWVDSYRNQWRRFWHLNVTLLKVKQGHFETAILVAWSIIAHVVKPRWFIKTVWANFLINNLRSFFTNCKRGKVQRLHLQTVCISYFYNPAYWITVWSNSLTYEPRNGQSPTLSRANCVTVYLMQTGFSQ